MIDFFISSALAHGSGGGDAPGSYGPLIFIPVIIAFALFLYTVIRKKVSVLVTGGAGATGGALVRKLLDRGHRVTVLDLYRNGGGRLDSVRSYRDLREVRGDIRDSETLRDALQECDAVIHLAAVSGALPPLVRAARDAGVKRFINATPGTPVPHAGFVTCTVRPAGFALDEMVDLFVFLLRQGNGKIEGRTFDATGKNRGGWNWWKW